MVVKSKDCLSQRHLLTKIFAVCAQLSGQVGSIDKYDRVDSLNSLAVNLQRIFYKQADQHIKPVETMQSLIWQGQLKLAQAWARDLGPDLQVLSDCSVLLFFAAYTTQSDDIGYVPNRMLDSLKMACSKYCSAFAVFQQTS